MTVKTSLKIVETSHVNGQKFDITELCSDVQWQTVRDSQAGSLTFKLKENGTVFLRNGDIVEAFWDEKKFFKGRVYKHTRTKEKAWAIVAYDLLYLFKSEDTVVFPANNAASRFEQICKLLNIPYKIGMVPRYNCVAKVADKQTYYTMIDEAIQETAERSNERYMIYDDAGTVRFIGYQELNTALIIGDKSLLTDFQFDVSIEELYNAVKVIKENEKKKTREVYQARDNGNISKWGLLQKVESPNDAKMNAQQMQAQADAKLKELNRISYTFNLTAIGYMPFRAGNNFHLQMGELISDLGKSDFVCSTISCTHSFLPTHTMELEVELILK